MADDFDLDSRLPTDDSSTSREPSEEELGLRRVVEDPDVCPYLPQQTANMPLCVPTNKVSAPDLDKLLDAGYRRTGYFFYRTECPSCAACEPLRLEVSQFQASRSQRRARRSGEANLTFQAQLPTVDDRRIELFNLHRASRELDHGNPPIDRADYESFLTNSQFPVLELSLWLNSELIAIAIADVGQRSMSAVYCFFDPAAAALSPGTNAILKQIEIAQQAQLKWFYLGMYVAENRHLNYKARFQPHQRRINGIWENFSRSQKSD